LKPLENRLRQLADKAVRAPYGFSLYPFHD
jgi:hypothetical protein